jgi:hypothetical protein
MQEISLTRLRRANAVYFFISGFGYSSWTSRIPESKSLKLNDAISVPCFYDASGLDSYDAFTGKLLDISKAGPSYCRAMVYNGVWPVLVSAVYMGVR